MHRIQLKGPWIVGSERVRLPGDWESLCARGTLRLSRRFHRPTGLDPGSRIFILLPAAWNVPRVSINGTDVPTAGVTGFWERFEISTEVAAQAAHELEIEVLQGARAPFLVAIEIQPAGETL